MNLYLNVTLSLFLIGISLFTALAPNKFGEDALKMLAAYTIAASALSIVLSLIDEKESNESKADQLHACARELTEIYNKYSDEFKNSESVRTTVQHEYQRSLERCPINHDDLDFERVRHESPELFERKKSYTLYVVRYTLNVYWKYATFFGINAALFYILLRV